MRESQAFLHIKIQVSQAPALGGSAAGTLQVAYDSSTSLNSPGQKP